MLVAGRSKACVGQLKPAEASLSIICMWCQPNNLGVCNNCSTGKAFLMPSKCPEHTEESLKHAQVYSINASFSISVNNNVTAAVIGSWSSMNVGIQLLENSLWPHLPAKRPCCCRVCRPADSSRT